MNEEKLPVYRTFLIPFEGISVRHVTHKDVKDWEHLLQKLNAFLRIGVKEISSDTYEKFELVGDLVTAFFRAPLTADPMQGLAPSPFKLYLLVRLSSEELEIRRHLLDNPTQIHQFISFIEKTQHAIKPLDEIFMQLDDTELRDLVFRSWLVHPADTRPIFNMSSLVTHLLSVSSLAWAFGCQRGERREELALIRLAAMAHDIAKPLNPRQHVESSKKLAGTIYRDVLSQESIERIKKHIEEHHRKDSPIHRADVLSSSIDRMKQMATTLLSEELNKPEYREIAKQLTGTETDPIELAYSGGENSWAFWEKLHEKHPEKIKLLSEKLVESAEALSVNWSSTTTDDIQYYLVDVGGIQDFVYRSRKLAMLSGRSLLVNLLVTFIIPAYLQLSLAEQTRHWIPLESFYITSGGNVSGIVPTVISHSFQKILDQLREKISQDLGLTLYTAFSPMTSRYSELFDAVNKQMALAKIIPQTQRQKLEMKIPNPSRLCNACYKDEYSDETTKLCETCGNALSISRQLSFKRKYEIGFVLNNQRLIPKEFLESSPEDAVTYAMEIIAGSKAPPGEEELPNIAVVKGDGDSMGDFFSRAINLTDALERSFRVEMAMKKAYEKCLTYLLNKNDSQNVCRVFLGTIYMGGDDFLIFSPSFIALPLAYTISSEFREQMAGKCSLSTGVVSVPPKHNIWQAIDAASAMLQAAKKVSRIDKTAYICFDALDTGILSGEVASTRLAKERSLGLSMRPLPIEPRADIISLVSLFELLGYSRDAAFPDSLFGWVERFRPDTVRDSELEELRQVRRVVVEVLQAVKSRLENWGEAQKREALTLATIYLARQANRNKKGSAGLYEMLKNILLNTYADQQSPLTDLDKAAKIVGGGMI